MILPMQAFRASSLSERRSNGLGNSDSFMQGVSTSAVFKVVHLRDFCLDNAVPDYKFFIIIPVIILKKYRLIGAVL